MVHPQEMRTVALLAQIALVAFVIVTLVLLVFLVLLCCFNVVSTVRRRQEIRLSGIGFILITLADFILLIISLKIHNSTPKL